MSEVIFSAVMLAFSYCGIDIDPIVQHYFFDFGIIQVSIAGTGSDEENVCACSNIVSFLHAYSNMALVSVGDKVICGASGL